LVNIWYFNLFFFQSPVTCLKCTNPTINPITLTSTSTTLTSSSLIVSSTSAPSKETISSSPNEKLISCKNELKCQNSGVFDLTTCECRCMPSYTGPTCDALNCKVSQLSTCDTVFSSVQCSLQVIKNLCPYLCGDCTAKNEIKNMKL